LSEITVTGVRESQIRAIELKRLGAEYPGQHLGREHRPVAPT